MESNSVHHDPDDPRALLDVADQARQRLAAGLRLPGRLYPALTAAVTIQVGTAAYGIASQTAVGLAVALVGAAIFLGVAVFEVRQFRRINGVRVDGLARQIILGTGTTGSLVYAGAFAAATWAAFDSLWWLVATAAVAGGVGYASCVRQWWHSYQRDPATNASGTSPRVLAALSVIACLGLVALVVAR